MALVSIFLYVILLISLGLLVHSYVIYPFIAKISATGKELNKVKYTAEDNWPRVAVLMAAYNEEVLIEQKLHSLLAQEYPKEKIDIYIGSDASTDQTNAILSEYSSKNEHIYFIPFEKRTGKPGIINTLAQEAFNKSKGEGELLFLLTDASVLLDEKVTKYLARHFKNSKIGLVDAHMNYTGMRKEGISSSENTYISGEVSLKYNESKAWGRMMGPFGGCFMMRSELFHPVPSNFLVDDFFLSMKVLQAEGLVINDLEALCKEPVTHAISDEFRRKKRISTGNFQNLNAFRKLALPINLTGFAFFSHKVIRWMGPFLMITILLASVMLAISGSGVAFFLLIVQLTWYLLLPILDWVLTQIGINFSVLRNVRYFNLMNLALLSGFIKFVGGVETNVWQPTTRT